MCETIQDLRQRLACDDSAPRRARRLVRCAACPDHRADLDGALLLVSELVTNAVVHAGPPVLVSVRCTSRTLRLGVHDGARQASELCPPRGQEPATADVRPGSADSDGDGTDVDGALPDLDEHGRGLALVEAVADSWWVDRTDVGKWVYAEISVLDHAA